MATAPSEPAPHAPAVGTDRRRRRGALARVLAIEIERAFGLPAHPLLIHVPLVFIPILGLAALAALSSPAGRALRAAGRGVRGRDAGRHAAGGGRRRGLPGGPRPQPADATTRRCRTTRTRAHRCGCTICAHVRAGRPAVRQAAARCADRPAGAAVLLALTAIFYVIRTGHLGAKLAWGARRGRGPGTVDKVNE